MKQWTVLARNKWVAGAIITESLNENDRDIRLYTATVRGRRNFHIYEGDPRRIDTKKIMERVQQVRDRIDAGDESVFRDNVTLVPEVESEAQKQIHTLKEEIKALMELNRSEAHPMGCGLRNGQIRRLKVQISDLESDERASQGLRMYHGSVSFRADAIVKSGLRSPFVTNSFELATKYANSRSQDYGGRPVVYSFMADPQRLRYDAHAMKTPEAHAGKSKEELLHIVQHALLEFSRTNPELTQYGEKIFVPETEYLLSLEAVSCCAYAGTVPFSKLTVLGGESDV